MSSQLVRSRLEAFRLASRNGLIRLPPCAIGAGQLLPTFHLLRTFICELWFDVFFISMPLLFFFYYYYFFLNVGCSQLEFDSCSVCSIQQRATVDFNGLIGRFVECRFPLRLNQVCLAIITNCLSTVRNWIIHEIKPLSRYLTFQSKVGVSVNSNEF